jgi:hypothetical protein
MMATTGDAVQLGVVEPVEEMHGARPLRGRHHAHLAGVFGVPDGHERRRFLVPGLDESDAGSRVGAVGSAVILGAARSASVLRPSVLRRRAPMKPLMPSPL